MVLACRQQLQHASFTCAGMFLMVGCWPPPCQWVCVSRMSTFACIRTC